jgi:hypothetical protein
MENSGRPDANEIHGIIVGYALYFSLLAVIITCKFSTSLKHPNKSNQTITAEDYFQTAVLSLCAMMITGTILTLKWSHVNYHDNPLIQYYGYNNICIVFDTPPSSFVMPICWFFTGFFLVVKLFFFVRQFRFCIIYFDFSVMLLRIRKGYGDFRS